MPELNPNSPPPLLPSPPAPPPSSPAARFTAPAILGHLIEFGYSPPHTHPAANPLPPEWQLAYDAVMAVRGSRTDRMAAFEEFVRSDAGSFAMKADVLAHAPVRENRGLRNRYLRNASDALGPPPILEWFVEGLFARPSLNLIVGDPGAKKTSLAIDLAVCVSLGLPWLDRKTIQCPALYIDEETGYPRLWSRLHAALLARGATHLSPFHFMCLPTYDLRNADESGDLLRSAESCAAGLIIIDALADVMRGGDENSVLSILPVFNNLRRISEECRAAVIVLHHTNKSGFFRGSSSISAAVDLMLHIHSPAASPLIRLTPLKSRDSLPLPFSARAHFEPDRFYLTPTDETFAEKLTPREQEIVDYLQVHGESSSRQLMHQLDFTSSAIRRVISELMAKRQITRVDGGKQGQKATYDLNSGFRRGGLQTALNSADEVQPRRNSHEFNGL